MANVSELTKCAHSEEGWCMSCVEKAFRIRGEFADDSIYIMLKNVLNSVKRGVAGSKFNEMGPVRVELTPGAPSPIKLTFDVRY